MSLNTLPSRTGRGIPLLLLAALVAASGCARESTATCATW